MRALNAWIPANLHAALVREREGRGMSVNEMVREALAEWLKRQTHRTRKGVR